MTRFPWGRAMELGLGQLRLAPDQFWRMTLQELNAAARGAGFVPSVVALSRSRLDELTQKFPDY